MSSNTGRCSFRSRLLGARGGNRARSAGDGPGIHSDRARALPGTALSGAPRRPDIYARIGFTTWASSTPVSFASRP